jgi:hypothetical protein
VALIFGGRNKKTRPAGASDEPPIERRERAADAACCSLCHSCILFRDAAGVVVFQPGGLRSTLISLNEVADGDYRPGWFTKDQARRNVAKLPETSRALNFALLTWARIRPELGGSSPDGRPALCSLR